LSTKPIALAISPHDRLFLDEAEGELGVALSDGAAVRIRRAFASSSAAGLLHLATTELQIELPLSLSFARSIARDYLTRLCHTPAPDETSQVAPIAPLSSEALAKNILEAPPMKGLEYLTPEALASAYTATSVTDFPRAEPTYATARSSICRSNGER
jgi:non-specific serine/threonine protein kinase